MRKSLFVFITILGLGYGGDTANAQDNGEDNVGTWLMYFGTFQVAEKWSIHNELQYRTFEILNNFNQLLPRVGVNYHISDNAQVTLGYAHIPTDPSFEEFDGERNVTENRIFQQFILRNKVGKFKFSHRYRLEQRFINNPNLGNDTQHRARYFLRITYPLNDTWFLTAYEEIFLNLQEEQFDGLDQSIFGQNRLYGALGYNVNSNVALQLGYLKNHFNNTNFDRLQLGVWWKADFRKKKES